MSSSDVLHVLLSCMSHISKTFFQDVFKMDFLKFPEKILFTLTYLFLLFYLNVAFLSLVPKFSQHEVVAPTKNQRCYNVVFSMSVFQPSINVKSTSLLITLSGIV